MIGFPYTYGDELTNEESQKNFKLFLKTYGPTLCMNGLLILLSQSAHAVDKPVQTPTPKPDGAVVPKADPSTPVFAPIIPPTDLVHSKGWAFSGVGVLAWLCISAASTGHPALLVACSTVLLYIVGARK